MESQGPPPHVVALDIAAGHWKAQAIRAFVSTGLAAVMEKECSDENKSVSSDKLAEYANLHPVATYRLLRFLATFDVTVQEPSDKAFKLGAVGAVLCPNHPQSVAKKVLWESSFTCVHAWNSLTIFLETNKCSAVKVLGMEMFPYLAENPNELATFQEAMSGYSKEEALFLSNPNLSPTLDLSSYETVCDLGGAEGALALSLAKRFTACSQWIVSDLPEAIARIDVAALPANFKVESCDFFKSVPVADAYVLKHIIHDWDDEKSSTIFKKIKEANPKAAVFIIEFGPMPGPNVPHISKGFDIHMGVMLGSSQRTQEEYDELFASNDYEHTECHKLAGGAFPLYVQELTLKR